MLQSTFLFGPHLYWYIYFYFESREERQRVDSYDILDVTSGSEFNDYAEAYTYAETMNSMYNLIHLLFHAHDKDLSRQDSSNLDADEDTVSPYLLEHAYPIKHIVTYLYYVV